MNLTTLADHNFRVASNDGAVSILVSKELLITEDLMGNAEIRLIPHDAIEFANAILAAAGGGTNA